MSSSTTGLRLQLPAGWIEGAHCQDEVITSLPTVRAFKNIPYAAVPGDERRWLPPQAVEPWAGTRACIDFGSIAVQAAPPGESGHAGAFDCLSLNVWCPPSGNGPYPVMVWIPGGGFMRGGAADALYDGRAMARQGIVFVSFNYRIGVEGFMHFDDASPNRGLQDQQAALQWVHENIALFGGDSSRVTLAGVSAGAGSITHLMGLPDCAPLFQRVILQSPSMQSHSLEDAQRIRHALAGVLGIAPTRQAVAQVPLADLTRALASFLGNEALKHQWGLRPQHYFPLRPVIDGQLLSAEPLQAIQKQLDLDLDFGLPRKPVLLGSNSEEMRFYLVPNGEIDRIDEARVRAFVDDIGLPLHRLREYQENYQEKMASASWGDVLSCIQSDYYYRLPVQALARQLIQADCPTFLYEFAWPSPLHGGRLGASHAMEIPFTLGNTGLPRAQAFIGAVPSEALAHDMHHRWVQFVCGQDMPNWSNTDTNLRIFK
ncbi:MAG: carboxylesterase family protein [Burkholderiaceae bacterium]